MKTTITSGIVVTECDEPDTEEIEITGLSQESERREALADAYADGAVCESCMWHDSGVDIYSGRRWRECSCISPDACPALNPKSIAAAMRRPAS